MSLCGCVSGCLFSNGTKGIWAAKEMAWQTQGYITDRDNEEKCNRDLYHNIPNLIIKSCFIVLRHLPTEKHGIYIRTATICIILLADEGPRQKRKCNLWFLIRAKSSKADWKWHEIVRIMSVVCGLAKCLADWYSQEQEQEL